MGEARVSLHDAVIRLRRRLELKRARPFNTHAGAFPNLAGPSYTLPGPCLTHTDHSLNQAGPVPTYTGPFSIQGGPSHAQADPCPTQAGPCPTQAGPCPTQVGPCPTQAGPCPTQAGPVPTYTGPLSIQAGPSHTKSGQIETQNMGKLQTAALTCKHCKMVLSSKRSLRRHVKTAHEEPKYSCDHCGRHFGRSDHLKLHIEGKHTISRPKYPCSKCGKSFAKAGYRNQHCRTCSSVREQPIPGYTGDESAAMDVGVDTKEVGANAQLDVETGSSTVFSEQPSNVDKDRVVYTCLKCRCEYVKKSCLMQHLSRGCDGPTLLSCSHCDYKTRHKNCLKRHIFKHHGDVHTQ